MPLHRDIFWVGRQWAVTGFGVQAVDQRLRGVLDIEIARLWDDDFLQGRRSKPGVNAGDFDKAVAIARDRYPQAQGATPVMDVPRASEAIDPPKVASALAPAIASAVVPAMKLRAEGRLARFLPQWRIRPAARPGR